MRLSPLFVLVIVILAMLVTAAAAAATYIGVRQIVLQAPIELPPPPQLGAPQPTAIPRVANTPAAQAQPTAVGVLPQAPADNSTIPVWTDPKRLTILLLGVDQRPGERGPFRTDTIIVLSLDPIRKTAAMLSIPRDVWVKIPDISPPLSPNRINAANFIGDQLNYPPDGGGPKLAVRTVEALLGIPIHRYALINFEAFRTVIDALGEVTVCPTERIFDDQYPDYETYGVITVEFQPGCQALDSTRLLQYARVRHNAGDDFGRAARQQEVIRAVRERALSLGGVTALIGKAGAIWDALAQNIRTDLTFEEILALASLAQEITDIQSAVLTIKRQGEGGQLLYSTLPSGEQVLVPIAEEIFALVVRLFDSGTGAPANLPMAAENARIYVENGALVDGLAARTRDRLIGEGFNVVEIGTLKSDFPYPKTEIHVYTGKMETARYLAQVLGLDGTAIRVESDAPIGIDIKLIVGQDLAR
jgi:LCP family protein required for cell wall assembly